MYFFTKKSAPNFPGVGAEGVCFPRGRPVGAPSKNSPGVDVDLVVRAVND